MCKECSLYGESNKGGIYVRKGVKAYWGYRSKKRAREKAA
jgi:hypothetical protein